MWRVEERPEVTIGSVDGADEYLFTNIVAGVLLEDGTVVLQNSVTRSLFELRYFDVGGQHLATASRWGQGPYEFDNLVAMSRLPGDSVFVLSVFDWRYAVFGPRGERVRDGRVPGPFPIGVEYPAIDAAHIGVGSVSFEAQAPGPQRRQEAFIVRTLAGASDTVAVLDGTYTFLENRGRFYSGYNAPFTPYTLSAAGPGVFWFGSADLPEVYGYRVNGLGMDTIRLNWPPTPVTGADRDRWSAEASSNPSRMRGAEELGFPDSLPVWGGLEVDHAGNVWVLPFEVPWAEGPQRWNVFSPLGEPVAAVTIPRAVAPQCTATGLGCRFELLDIGEDYMLLSRRDSLDVPQVHLLRLIKE